MAARAVAWPVANDVVIELAIRLHDQGDMATAGRLLQAKLLDRLVLEAVREDTVRQRQQVAAKSPRTNRLRDLIDQLVEARPSITASEALEELRHFEGGGVIESVNVEAGVIEWRDERHPAGLATLSGIRDRILRSKRRACAKSG